MQIGLIGVNHFSSRLEERECIAKAFQQAKVSNAVLISTCNRVELYFSSPKIAEMHSQILLSIRFHLDKNCEYALYSYFGAECFHHLGRVIAGVDSAIFGECEIQRQVKISYEKVRFRQKLSPHLHYLFQKGLKIGKAVRTELFTRQGNIKIAETMLEEISKKGLSGKKDTILFVGNSMVSRTLIAFFKQNGWERLTLSTRGQYEEHFLQVKEMGWKNLDNWTDYDVVVGATDFDGYLLKPTKCQKKVLLFDLSVPRIIDPKLRSSLHTLYNIDELARMTQKRSRRGKKEIRFYEEIIFQAVKRQIHLFKQKEQAKWRYMAC